MPGRPRPRRPARAPAPARTPPAPPPPRPTVAPAPAEAADHATQSAELLGQDERIRRAVRRGREWDKLVRNWVRFIEDAIEGWANEGRSFPSERARREAIARLIEGTLERLREDPRKWIREHCERERDRDRDRDG